MSLINLVRFRFFQLDNKILDSLIKSMVESHIFLFGGHDADVLEVLEDGDLQTLGMMDYDKRLAHSFTAHPKVDPDTGNTCLMKNSMGKALS